MKKILFLLLVVCVVSCSYEKTGKGEYCLTIKAGEKECSNPVKFHTGSDYLDVWIYVDDSWKFTEEDVYHSYSGVAKVIGYSEGLSHRENSIRIGWKHEYGVGDFYLFREVNTGNYTSIAMGMDITYNAWYFFRLSEEGGEYVLRCEDKEARCPIYKDRRLGYIVWPSMAGSYRVWHDWNICLKIENYQ